MSQGIETLLFALGVGVPFFLLAWLLIRRSQRKCLRQEIDNGVQEARSKGYVEGAGCQTVDTLEEANQLIAKLEQANHERTKP
jgi:hypothetical protein